MGERGRDTGGVQASPRPFQNKAPALCSAFSKGPHTCWGDCCVADTESALQTLSKDTQGERAPPSGSHVHWHLLGVRPCAGPWGGEVFMAGSIGFQERLNISVCCIELDF